MFVSLFEYSDYRDDFTKFVDKRFDYDEFYTLIEGGYNSEDFVCYKFEDVYYIIDLSCELSLISISILVDVYAATFS